MNLPKKIGPRSKSCHAFVGWNAFLRRPKQHAGVFSASFPLTLCLAIAIVLSLVLRFSGMVYAQTPLPHFYITGIDTSAFPQVEVSVYGENLGEEFTEVPLTLREDGVQVDLEESTIAPTGAQTLLVLDAYQTIVNPGMTGDSMIQEITNAVSQLTQQGYLLADKDWLGFVSFDNSGEQAVAKVFSPWSSADHQVVINSILEYAGTQVATAKPNTPLYDLLFTSLHYFDDQTPPQNLPRSIVVFSNGVDLIAAAQKEDLYRLAEDRNVRIHTVQVGPTSNREAQQNLQNIALNTGGTYVHLNQENASLDGLWQRMQASQNQQVLTYRTSNSNPDNLIVEATAGGSRYSAERNFPSMDIRPPRVTILQPDVDELEKALPDGSAMNFDTPVTDLEPKVLEILVDIEWPDGFERNLEQVVYSIDNRTIPVTEAPFESITFPIETLIEGAHEIRVVATDELGNKGEAIPKNFTIISNRPTPPPSVSEAAMAATVAAQETQAAQAAATRDVIAQATANAVATANAASIAANATVAAGEVATVQTGGQATAVTLGQGLQQAEEENEILRYMTYGGYGLAFVAIGLTIFVWANPRTRKRATEIVSGTIGRLTEFWSPEGGQSAPMRTLKARLVPLDSSGGQTAAEIYGGSVRIGRDAALATVVINDRRVSRYHCRISEEGNGLFRIWDEGSSSGTYVNKEQVTMSGRLLQPGDIINFGPVEYRFEPFTDSQSTTVSTQAGTWFGDATEPFVLNPQSTQSTRPYEPPTADTYGAMPTSYTAAPTNYAEPPPPTNFSIHDSATVIFQNPESSSNQPTKSGQDTTDRYTSPLRNQDEPDPYSDRGGSGKTNIDDATRH